MRRHDNPHNDIQHTLSKTTLSIMALTTEYAECPKLSPFCWCHYAECCYAEYRRAQYNHL